MHKHRNIFYTCTWLVLVLLTTPVLADTPTLSWKLLRSIQREPAHFTQGLVYADAQLFESTGRYGESRLIAYDARTLQRRKQIFLRDDVFGEGLTFLNNTLYQCSWKSQELFTYSTALQALQTLAVHGESWGLTTDGHSLIMSNGSDTLQFLDPANGKTVRTLTVKDADGKHWHDINELEWIDGNILANIWHDNIVLVIDGSSGRVTGRFDFSELDQIVTLLLPNRDSEQVLNGIAWNPATHTLLVTGKDWPLWFELEITLH